MDPVIVTTQRQLNAAIQTAFEPWVPKLASRLQSDERSSASKEYFTNPEAQEYLGLSKATLARYRANGALPYSKVGQSVYYRREDIVALLDRHAVPARTR